jgi:hypothetical protein
MSEKGRLRFVGVCDVVIRRRGAKILARGQ